MISAQQLIECRHAATKLRRRVVHGGAIQHYHQCLFCGQASGGAVARSVWSAATQPIEAWDCNLEKECSEKREQHYLEIKESWENKQRKENDDFWKRWHAHMGSQKWYKIRSKVIARCGNLCEGCRDRPVAQVHHLTYQHLGDEFLFELVGLCLECHRRIHPDSNNPNA